MKTDDARSALTGTGSGKLSAIVLRCKSVGRVVGGNRVVGWGLLRIAQFHVLGEMKT